MSNKEEKEKCELSHSHITDEYYVLTCKTHGDLGVYRTTPPKNNEYYLLMKDHIAMPLFIASTDEGPITLYYYMPCDKFEQLSN